MSREVFGKMQLRFKTLLVIGFITYLFLLCVNCQTTINVTEVMKYCSVNVLCNFPYKFCNSRGECEYCEKYCKLPSDEIPQGCEVMCLFITKQVISMHESNQRCSTATTSNATQCGQTNYQTPTGSDFLIPFIVIAVVFVIIVVAAVFIYILKKCIFQRPKKSGSNTVQGNPALRTPLMPNPKNNQVTRTTSGNPVVNPQNDRKVCV